MSLSRREALADVALRYSVPIIEDDAYAMLPRASCRPSPPSRPSSPTTSPAFPSAWARACATPTSAHPTPGRRSGWPGAARHHRHGVTHHQRPGHHLGAGRHGGRHAAGHPRRVRGALSAGDGAPGRARGARAARGLPPVAAARRQLEPGGIRLLHAHEEAWAWWPARPSAPTATRPTRCASAWAGRCRGRTVRHALELIADTLEHPLHPHSTRMSATVISTGTPRQRVAAAGAAGRLDQRMLAQLAEQQLERRAGDVLSPADRRQWHGAVPLAQRDIDHGRQGEAALRRQTHGVFLVDGLAGQGGEGVSGAGRAGRVRPVGVRKPQKVSGAVLPFPRPVFDNAGPHKLRRPLLSLPALNPFRFDFTRFDAAIVDLDGTMVDRAWPRGCRRCARRACAWPA
jgi:hypothetical protein